MTATIDANTLVYIANDADPSHLPANEALNTLRQSGELLVLFPPVLVAFLRVATHPNVFPRPLTLAAAFAVARRLLDQPFVSFAWAGDTCLDLLEEVSRAPNARGKLIHDAEIVALMREHGVSKILTADRDFLKFDGIEAILLSVCLAPQLLTRTA